MHGKGGGGRGGGGKWGWVADLGLIHMQEDFS